MIKSSQIVHHGESLEVLKTTPGDSAKLVIYDPLFDLESTAYREYLKEIDRVVSNDGSIYVFTDWKNLNRVQNIINEMPWHHLNMIIWSRMSPGTNTKTYKTGYEVILWYVKDQKNYTFNKQFRKIVGDQVLPYKNKDGSPRGWFYDESTGERTRWAETSNVWCYTRPTWSAEESVAHGMQKPLQLADRIILTSTNEGELVLDVFSGSGTFAVSSRLLNRSYIGTEREKDYIDIIEQRLKTCFDLKHIETPQVTSQTPIHDNEFFQ